MNFSQEELDRYNRQIMMEGWGIETQEKIRHSTVFIAGAGGLGSPVSIYLAVAGIGNIRICDFDAPEHSNLNRQILQGDPRHGNGLDQIGLGSCKPHQKPEYHRQPQNPQNRNLLGRFVKVYLQHSVKILFHRPLSLKLRERLGFGSTKDTETISLHHPDAPTSSETSPVPKLTI